MAAQHVGFVAVHGGFHGVFRDVVPLTDRHGGIEVVGGDEDQDGIEVIAMLRLQLLQDIQSHMKLLLWHLLYCRHRQPHTQI